ncbi:MAG: DUF2975 domain-containing protein [Bacteroidales bacterium]|nr:DUF2975 domain-containing protein [Candidatus Colimorpha pelethequi]
MTKSSSNIKRIWVLYGLFFAIMLLCLVLFFSNFISSEEPTIFKQIENSLRNKQQYAVGITDLQHNSDASCHTFQVEGENDGLNITARVNRFDIAVTADDKQEIDSPYTTWAVILQSFSAIALVAIFVTLILLLIAFYKSIKAGKIFQRRGVKWIRLIGILMLLMTLSMDYSIYLEREYAMTLLANTDWFPEHHFTIHFTRIFFSIIILFVAEILNIGYDIQEEQELTI